MSRDADRYLEKCDMNNQPEQLLTVAEVSAELRLGESTVWRLVKEAALPSPIKLGGSTRWLRSEIVAHINRLAREQRNADHRPVCVLDQEGV